MSIESKFKKTEDGDYEYDGRTIGEDEKIEIIIKSLVSYIVALCKQEDQYSTIGYLTGKSSVDGRLKKILRFTGNLKESFIMEEISSAFYELVIQNTSVLTSELKFMKWKIDYTLNEDHLTLDGLHENFWKLINPNEFLELYESWDGVEQSKWKKEISSRRLRIAKRFVKDFPNREFIREQLYRYCITLRPKMVLPDSYNNINTDRVCLPYDYITKEVSIGTIINEAKDSYSHEYQSLCNFINENPTAKAVKKVVALKNEYDEVFKLAHDIWIIQKFYNLDLKSNNILGAVKRRISVPLLISNDVTYYKMYNEFRKQIDDLCTKKIAEVTKRLNKLDLKYAEMKEEMAAKKKTPEDRILSIPFGVVSSIDELIEIPDFSEVDPNFRAKYYQEYMESKVNGINVSFADYLADYYQRQVRLIMNEPATSSEKAGYDYVTHNGDKRSFDEYVRDRRLDRSGLSMLHELIIQERKREEFAQTVYKEYVLYLMSEKDKKKAKTFSEFVKEKYYVDDIDVPFEKKEQYEKIKGLK